MCMPILKASVFPDFESLLKNMGFKGGFFSRGKLLSELQKLLLKPVFWEMGGTV